MRKKLRLKQINAVKFDEYCKDMVLSIPNRYHQSIKIHKRPVEQLLDACIKPGL